MNNRERFNITMAKIWEGIEQRRTAFLVVAAMVVFVVTYLLVLPAFTLDKQEAAEQGGITVSEEAKTADAGAEPTSGTIDKDTKLKFEGEGFTVSALCAVKTELPKTTELTAEKIDRKASPEAYETYYDKALKAVRKDAKKSGGAEVRDLEFTQFYDITLSADGEKVTAAEPVSIALSFAKAQKVSDPGQLRIVRLTEDADTGKLQAEVLPEDEVTLDLTQKENLKEAGFTAEGSSVCAIVATSLEETVLASDGKNYKVSVTCPPEAGIPEGAKLAVSELASKSDAYQGYVNKAESTLGMDKGSAGYIRLFDIKILDADGHKVQPADGTTVDVKIELADAASDNLSVVHFADESKKGEVVNAETKKKSVEFAAEGFSKYAIVATVIEKNVLASDGQNYRITVTCGPETGIPENADLAVKEIIPAENLEDGETDAWQEYAYMVRETLGWESGSASYLRLFDIKIVDKDDPNVQYQPAEGTTVDVRIELTDSSSDELNVVHFSDGDDTGSVVDAEVDGQTVSFEALGFSVYAVVDGPSAASIGWHKVTSLDELLTHSEGLYIGHINGYYFKNSTVQTNGRTGIAKTSPAQASPSLDSAARYYFESAGSEGQYYVYCMNGETKRYVKNNNNNSLELSDETGKTAFTVTVDENGVFRFHNGEWYWNMQGGNTGTRFCSWNSATDNNAKMNVWYYDNITTDPYDLGGKSYGLLTWNGGKTAKAMMASENSGVDDEGNPYQGCLEAKFLTVMSNKSDSKDKLYVPQNTADKITDWSFEWKRDDIYYVKGKDENGNTKYLSITSDGLSLLGSPDDTCYIQVVPGAAGIHKGQIALKSANPGGETLTYSGKYAQGFDIGGEAGSEWLYLATDKPEEILTDYVKVNTATKVSVSDTENVYTGQKVIIYTREWVNDHYEYYAINNSGKLVPCAESGNSIEWVSGNLDDMLWQFTEYTYEGTDTPSGYYELQNLYAKTNGDPSYLAPKYSEAGTVSGILSQSTVGIFLDGRQKKQYYSPIVAWDTPQYMYSGLTVDLDEDDPIIKPCAKVDGLDFYFAIMENLPVDDEIHLVPTVDNTQFGIEMKMYNLKNGKTNDATGQMNKFLGNTTSNGMTTVHTQGLLSTNLTNGYPTAAGGSLADLFSMGEITNANHLFIESTYRATGYYEYNSAQNFAKLTPNGDFAVYQELGTNDSTSKNTLKHGQFFPYNSIKPGYFASANGENLYSATGSLLPDSDARKHEQLYLVEGDTDYFFAMELKASFEQTPSGLDAWGHDIIFEFSGDDDFWLYVDDELVIDLGGIHSAVPGSVNFRTGEVYVNGTQTTLYELFYNNYKDRNHTEAEAREYVNSKFVQNSNGQYVFADGTTHKMNIFYMERGAGASNLHMKFNLAAVKKGTVQLSKELGGVDSSEMSYAVFPYQIYYTMEDNPDTEEDESAGKIMLRNAFDPASALEGYYSKFGRPESTDYVFYKDRMQPVTFLPELKIGDATYYNVFMLKPGETAEINFPVRRDDPSGKEYTVDKYRIVECGIDPAVYEKVTANGVDIAGEQERSDEHYYNYGIDAATTDARPKVNYVNTPRALQSLEFTKELYRKHDGAVEKIGLYNSAGNYIGSESDPDLETAKNSAFDFRLSFKSPYDDDFAEANQMTYHVKDPAGCYCRWDYSAQTFVRITDAEKYPNGTPDFNNLTEDYIDENGTVVHQDRFWASFETGAHGSITGIPAYYTIEVRELVPGTEYRIIERPTETPDGFKFYQYVNNDGILHADQYDPWDGIDGTIKATDKSKVWVRNYKGYGLRLEKVWEDATSIQNRDPAYFAVYTVDEDGKPGQIVQNSVQQLAYTSDQKKQQLYWWYLNLPVENTDLQDYAVFEVELTGTGITVDANGFVTGYETIEPVIEGGGITLNGMLNGQTTLKPIDYEVTYADPELIGDNVMKYKATNTPASLPSVRIMKTDWDGDPLAGADFTLKYGENLASSLFDPETKTSGEDGLVAQIYLQENVTYTLEEILTPQGYVGLETSLEIGIELTKSGWKLNVSPAIAEGAPEFYTVTVENNVITLTVKNHPYDLEAVKVDSTNTDVQVAGAKFDLYKQVTIGETSTWDEEHPVYKNLTTGEDGVIPKINKDLPAGTYQLREQEAPSRYSKLTDNIDITVSKTGVITLGSHPDGVKLTSVTDASGKITYSLAIPNTPLPLKLVKQDDKGNNLTGAKFKLTTLNENSVWVVVKDRDNKTVYDDVDMSLVSEFEFSDLPAGRYRLEETLAPAGCLILTKYVYFRINTDRTVELTKEDGTTGNDNSQASISHNEAGVYAITVKNTPGVELPHTGGHGTGLFTLLGGILVLGAGALLFRRKRAGARR